MNDEGDQQLRLVLQTNQGIHNMLAQFGNIGGSEIAQLTILGPRPDIFVRVGIRSMRWEVLDHYSRMLGQPGFNYLGLAMDLVAVPDDRPGSSHRTLELLQEEENLFAVEI